MNIRHLLQTPNPLFEGTLSKKNEKPLHSHSPFCIRFLNKADANDMFHLSLEIYKNLGPDEQKFLHKHESVDFYKNVFSNPNIAYIGIFHQNRLIGLSYLKVCKNALEVAKEIPEACLKMPKNQSVAILGGDCVLPTFRGNKLNQLMVQIRKNIARKLNIPYAVSIIDRNNHRNLSPYFLNNFQLTAAGIDPSDDGSIYVMQASLMPQKVISHQKGAFVRIHSLDEIEQLLSQGYQGIHFNARNGILELALPTQKSQRETHPVPFLCKTRGAYSYV